MRKVLLKVLIVLCVIVGIGLLMQSFKGQEQAPLFDAVTGVTLSDGEIIF